MRHLPGGPDRAEGLILDHKLFRAVSDGPESSLVGAMSEKRVRFSVFRCRDSKSATDSNQA